MSHDLDVVYASIVTKFSPHTGDPATILRNETGLADLLREKLDERITLVSDPRNDEEPDHAEVAALRAERDTWALLQTLNSVRSFDDEPTSTAQEVLDTNAFAPPQTLVNHLIRSSKILRELMVVKTWAEDTAPEPAPPESRTGYWNYTRHWIVHNKRVSGARTTSSHANIVREMDPDVVNREDGKMLDAMDDAYERSLSQSIYACIRAGRLEQAIDICKAVHHPWRSALLRGGELYTWGLFSRSAADAADAGMDETFSTDSTGAGNKRRRLWKQTCAAAARAPSLSQPTRAMYAAIAPQQSTLPALLSQCRTWGDHLWAHISVLFEDRIDAQLAQLKGCFWLNGMAALQTPKASGEGMEDDVYQDDDTWKAQVRRQLTSLSEVAVEDGPAASDFYHTTQLLTITDQTEELVDNVAVYINSMQFNQSSPRVQHRIVRFFAHFCLFNRFLDTPISPHASLAIIEKYIEFLAAENKTDLIALYAASLGSAAVDRYADYLASLPPSITREERHATLKRAREHNVDPVQVALAVAEKVAALAFKQLPGLRVTAPDPVELYQRKKLDEDELRLIKSVEWLVFEEETLPKALVSVNNIVRYFLATGNIDAAEFALGQVPHNIADHAVAETQRSEHVHCQGFVSLWRLFGDVVQIAADEPRRTGTTVLEREAHGAWVRDYTVRLQELHGQAVYLLTNDWLRIDDSEPPYSKDVRDRIFELELVRQLYIPEIIIRLHSVLMDSRHIAPQNVRLALELANTVADARYSLADEFFGNRAQKNRLSDYLSAVRSAAIEGMALGGTSDPFKIVIG